MRVGISPITRRNYDVQRGPERVPLKLYDWFLPALYQPGTDGALLKKAEGGTQKAASLVRTNLPKAPTGGFFGRKRRLWEIERWFAGPTRRITLTGFGGQGKTALAQEARSREAISGDVCGSRIRR